MRDVLKIALGIAIGLLGGAALLCFATALCLTTTTIPRVPTPVGVVHHGGVTPAPEERIGTAVTCDGIRLTLLSYEFSDQYWAKYSDRLERPPAGARFLWVRIRAENVGKNAENIPGSSAFSLSYEGREIMPRSMFMAEPRDRPLFKGGEIFPGVASDGWILFVVPAQIEVEKARIVFRPHSFGGSFVWSLAP